MQLILVLSLIGVLGVQVWTSYLQMHLSNFTIAAMFL